MHSCRRHVHLFPFLSSCLLWLLTVPKIKMVSLVHIHGMHCLELISSIHLYSFRNEIVIFCFPSTRRFDIIYKLSTNNVFFILFVLELSLKRNLLCCIFLTPNIHFKHKAWLLNMYEWSQVEQKKEVETTRSQQNLQAKACFMIHLEMYGSRIVFSNLCVS